MKQSTCILPALVFITASCTAPRQEKETEASTPTYDTMGSIEIFDKSLIEIIGEDAKIEILANGFDWVEGPVWIKDGGYLLFSDIFPNTIYKWKEGDSTSVYLTPSGYTSDIKRGGEIGSNGLMLNAAGQLMMCQHGDRQVALMNAPLSDPKPEYIPLAATYEGKRFNSPNDLAVHSSGDIYFTDPPYGLEKNMEDPAKEIDFQGVYRWSVADSSVTLLYDGITRPNGIAFSPDERKMYVACSDNNAANWTVFDVNVDGSVANPTLLLDATPEIGKQPGSCDGMDIHPNGTIFATGPGGVWIISQEGKLVGKIQTNERTANCTFDDMYKTLYITADSYILRVKMS